jgi:hypothetical protein
MRVLARVPGYGGLSICDVIGETATHYSLRFSHYSLVHAMRYVTSEVPDDAEREWTSEVFVRRKSKCYPVTEDRSDR